MGRAARVVAICLAVIAAASAATVCAVLLKPGMYRITSGSMEPLLPVGTVVMTSGVLAPTPHYPITFAADGRVVTHVLVGYAADGSLITRGTANPANDRWNAPVYPRDVRGRVVFGVLLFAPAFWTPERIGIVLAGCCVVLLFVIIGRT